jgi:hypothetical protein
MLAKKIRPPLWGGLKTKQKNYILSKSNGFFFYDRLENCGLENNIF